MGQVPVRPNSNDPRASGTERPLTRYLTQYLIVGSGRVSLHLQEYFRLENLPFSVWSRDKGSQDQFKALAEDASHVILAISDRSIEPFLQSHPWLSQKAVHLSGAVTTAL